MKLICMGKDIYIEIYTEDSLVSRNVVTSVLACKNM